MIRPLRVRHRRMIFVLALVVSALLIAALAVRRPPPTTTLPEALRPLAVEGS